jgi:hypothetical protein
MKPLPEMDMLIDYPFTKYKNDSMDITLISECFFFIGCQSGIYDVAKLFGKPVLLLNMYNWTFGGPLHCHDRGIIKHIFSKREQKFLSIEEIFSTEWEAQNTNNIVQDYSFFENTEDEIYDAVIEYMSYMQENLFPVSDLQIKSSNCIKRQAHLIFNNTESMLPENVLNNNENIKQKYRMCSQVEGSCGFICNFYLDKNWNIDDFVK